MRTIAYLGKYYAHKIRAATELALFRRTLEIDRRDSVTVHLQAAARYWRLYAATTLGQYGNPLWTNRVGYVDWRETYEEVLYDLTTVGARMEAFAMSPTPGGTILEAENSQVFFGDVATETPGFTATGYCDFSSRKRRSGILWTYDAPNSGSYVLEESQCGIPRLFSPSHQPIIRIVTLAN